MSWNRLLALSVTLALVGTPAAARAQLKAGPDDWPAWRGADRSGVSAETGLLKEWPADGPKLLWKTTKLGGGYSTPSVVGGRVYLMGSTGSDEFAIALDAKDGSQIWSTKIGAVGKPNQRPSYPGTRSTPTVDGDRIYVESSDGDLVCLDKDGKEVWHKHLVKDFGGNSGNWAYAESPLIDGDLLICTPGGSKATLAALNKKTGEVVWKSEVPGGDPAAFSSVVAADASGGKEYIQFLGKGVVGVAAKDGKFLWRYDKTSGTTNCSTPIFFDGCVFNSAASMRGGGSALLKLSADGDKVSATEVYFNKDLANHHGGVVRIGDSLYGTNNNGLVCVDFKSGDTKWKERSVGKGSIAAAEGLLYVRGEKDGEVALVEASPSGYKEKGRLKQPDRSKKSAWPHPVIAGGCLFLRDDDALFCYDIKAK
jgi:outer membrane protein assembly factor BamB